MSWFHFVDWGSLQSFFGEYGKLVATALGLVVAVITLAIWIFRYLSDSIREREREKLEAQLRKQEAQLFKQEAQLFKQEETIRQQEAGLQIRNDFIEKAEAELGWRWAEIENREAALESVRMAFNGKEHDLWSLHETRPPRDYVARMRHLRQTPVIMVANLKGGVGKTTLTANLAAHFSATGKRVLVIDVDYQGSLSNMLLLADGCQDVPAGVKSLLAPKQASSLEGATYPFVTVLKGSAIIPARYDLASLENQLMIGYLLRDEEDDGRFRLAESLLSQMPALKFDIVLIDAPPRLTSGAINAFCASTHLLVPTVYDDLSAEAVGTFLNGARILRDTLNPAIDLLGIVGMLTQQQTGLVPREQNSKLLAAEQATRAWSPNHHFFNRHIPRRAAISTAAGKSIAYLADLEVRGFFDELGQEIGSRLHFEQPTGWRTRGGLGARTSAGTMRPVEEQGTHRQ